MFAELKSKEDIQKSIVDYLGEDLDDTRRIQFYRSIIIYLLNSLITVVS